MDSWSLRQSGQKLHLKLVFTPMGVGGNGEPKTHERLMQDWSLSQSQSGQKVRSKVAVMFPVVQIGQLRREWCTVWQRH